IRQTANWASETTTASVPSGVAMVGMRPMTTAWAPCIPGRFRAYVFQQLWECPAGPPVGLGVNAMIEDTLVRCDKAEVDGTLAALTPAQRALVDKARAALMESDGLAKHAVSIMLDRTIKIPVYRWSQVEREFARMIAKAEQRKFPV